MRILIATDSYPPDLSGSAVFAARLAAGLARRTDDVHVVCPSEDGAPKVAVEDGVTLHRLRSWRLVIHPMVRFTPPVGVPRELRRVVAEVQPDVLHTQDHFTIGRAAILAARRAGVPIVATNHFLPGNLVPYVPRPVRASLTRALWWDFRRIYRNADYLTAPSPKAAGLVSQHGIAREVEPVSCGVDLDRFHPPVETSATIRKAFGLPNVPTIGYVGRIDAEKRLDELIGALAILVREQPVQLVLAGTGTQRSRLERLASQLGVADRVHFLGYVPDDQLLSVFGAADVFCMPGVAELQSISTLEAMASGLPVVVADAVALPHLVAANTNGRLFRPGDTADLANALGAVLASEQKRREMGAASRRLAEEHSEKQTVARYDAIYRCLLTPGRAGATREA